MTLLGSDGSSPGPGDASGGPESGGPRPPQEGVPLGQGNVTEVTRDGLRNVVSDRLAQTGAHGGRKRRSRRGDPNAMVPEAEFTSYYGRPVVKAAPWTNDIPAYLFMGGLAAGSSLVAAAADLTGRPVTRQAGRYTALAALLGSSYALIHDLGRPERFYNMLRVARLTSPMSMGTWILSAYAPAAGAAAVAELAPHVPGLPVWVRSVTPVAGRIAGISAAALAPALASYTSVLLSDTATPSWREGWRQLPVVFVSGAAASGAGIGLLAPLEESGPARRLAVGSAAVGIAAAYWLEHGTGLAGTAYSEGKAAPLTRASRGLLATGAALALAGRRSRAVSALAGLCLLSGSAIKRFSTFEAGLQSARDPKFTVVPQRERLRKGQQASERPIP
ncbi:MAG TPA: NrfD/PsrC family molybdoenzyme membrane anchor subunit [Frankiaceae bacterium]|nr:NrfD/PsrC family molybdoenzyme membrane anchor subunit [Frankiaceae bacterium]